MTQQESITNLLPLTVVRVLHLRDDLFLIGYGKQGIFEIRDFSKPTRTGTDPDDPIAYFNASKLNSDGTFDYLRDFDCKGNDESKIVAVFDSGTILYLDLKDNKHNCKSLTYNPIVYGSSGPRQIKLIQNLPGFDFTMLGTNPFGTDNSKTVVEIVPDYHTHHRVKLGNMSTLWNFYSNAKLDAYYTELEDKENVLET